MSLRSLEAFPLAYPEPNDGGRTGHTVLVRAEDSDGVVGWGEGWSRYPEASLAMCNVIDGLRAIVAESPSLAPVSTWRRMRKHAYWYGNGGVASLAISAIDMALWDMAGKRTGQSLVAMLGGSAHERLPAIASTHPHEASMSALLHEAESQAQGFRGFKFGMATGSPADLGTSCARDVEFVGGVRELLGDDAIIAVDARAAAGWDLGTAVARTQALEQFNIAWMEEPLVPNDFEGYRQLRSKTTTLIGYGEKGWTHQEYKDMVDRGHIDVVGVDPGRAEGITSCVKTLEYLEAGHKHFNSHSWSTALVASASLALSFVSPTTLVFEMKPLANPMQDELVRNPIKPVEGWVSPSVEPGLGADVDEEVVRRYALGS